MSDDPEIVIHDDKGGEHHFPAGFDPKRAAEIVRAQATPAPEGIGRRVARSALDALPGVGAIVGGVLGTPETLGAGSIPGMALGAGVGRGARDLIGHYTGLDAPSTPMQKAGAIAGETALTGATAAILPGVVAAAKAPVQAFREGMEQFGSGLPPVVRRLGNMIPSFPKAAPEPILTRPPWQTWGEAAPTTAAATEAAPVAASGALSAAEKGALAKQGYPPDLIARIEQASAPAPVSGTLRMAPPAPSPARPPIQVDQASLPEAWKPLTGEPHPLRPARVNVGAEVVGRQAGMTKEAVREATGPVLGEEPGSASPILPRDPSQRIIGRLVQMGPKGTAPAGETARDNYVMSATSDKARAQIKAYLDALRTVGFTGAAAMAARQRLIQKTPGDTGGVQ